MWIPDIKTYTKDLIINYPVACETKIDGEFVYWNGQGLINKRNVPKTAITRLPNRELYGELYYGEGKEFYSEIHSHYGVQNKVILFDTAEHDKPYIQRRTDLELLSKQGYEIVPMTICTNEAELMACFNKIIADGYEGVVVKPLDSRNDNNWVKMKREYTAKLLVRGLRKDKSIATVTMGTSDHIYCSVSLNGWYQVVDMLNKEKLERGIDKWVTGQDKENVFVNSNIVLELKHNGLIQPSNKLRHPRVKRICEVGSELNIQKGE